MQGFNVKPGQPAAYCHRFLVPSDWAGHRIKVRFDAVYSKAEVWMNGNSVGAHLGAFTPFEVDVSNAALPGKDNVLTLAVSSESLADILTVGREMVGHAMGGIIRKVRVFAVPEVNLASLHVQTTFDSEFQNAILHVHVDVANEGRKEVNGVECDLALREYGPGGKPVKLNPAVVKLPKIKAGEVISQTIQTPVEAPNKWDAEHPNLYVLNCQLRTGDRVYSTERRIGFRQVHTKDGRLFLNGQPIRLRGVSRQDTHPLMGRTVPLEDLRQDIDWILRSNCNNTYCCAFLPDEEVMNLCDEKGIYVMDEPGTCWAGIYAHDLQGRFFWKEERSDDPKFFPFYLQPDLEMIERDRDHPSVITWMLADESICGKNFLEVLKMVRAVDPSRPVHIAYDPGSGADQQGLDIVSSPFDFASWHYPGPKRFAQAAKSQRPVLFDQSASVVFADVPELMTDPGIHEVWGLQYAPFWEKIWESRSIAGAQVFNLNDDQYLIPSGLVTGNGDWGIVDPWRRAKADLWHVKKAHTPVKVQDLPLPLPAAGQPVEVPLENRYDFTNLSEVRIEWSLGAESGTVRADVPPHGRGTIIIRPSNTDLNGKTLSLKFYRKGLMVDAYKLLIGRNTEMAAPVQSKPHGRAELVQTKESMRVKGEGFEWAISRETGQIIEGRNKDQIVLVGGPVLMLLTTRDYLMTPGYPQPRPRSFSPLNAPCQGWKATSVSAKHSGVGVEIAVAGHYKEAAGNYTIYIGGDGDATISYRFTCTGAEKVALRQTGIVFYTPRSCDTLAWKRKAQWSVYPEDHIGRPEGVAKALPDPSLAEKTGDWMEVAYREKPSWPWSLDANALGTRDFRATRLNIFHASLKDSSGNGIMVSSDGTQHTRSFLDGSRVGLLVAWYSGPVLNTSWLHGLGEIAGIEPLILQPSAELKDTVRLSLVSV